MFKKIIFRNETKEVLSYISHGVTSIPSMGSIVTVADVEHYVVNIAYQYNKVDGKPIRALPGLKKQVFNISTVIVYLCSYQG